MQDLGPPSSYVALQEGTPVFSRDGGEVGRVEHVLADVDTDIFDGIVLDTSVLPGGHRFVDAPLVAEIHERCVVLDLDATEAERLPEPSANPAVMEAGPEDAEGSELERKLRGAWDRISGKH